MIFASLSYLYQLLGHLAALGRQAIDAARAEQPSRSWSALQWLHTWVIRLLVLFVPVLNFILLVTGLSVVPAERINLYLFHQATFKMLDELRQRLGLSAAQMPIVLEDCGNTVSSTIPIVCGACAPSPSTVKASPTSAAP